MEAGSPLQRLAIYEWDMTICCYSSHNMRMVMVLFWRGGGLLLVNIGHDHSVRMGNAWKATMHHEWKTG